MFLLSSLQQSKHVELAVALGLWKQKGFFPSKNLPFFHRTKAAELPRWEYAYTGERGTQFGGSILDGWGFTISSKAGAVRVGNNSPQVVLLMHR